MTDPKYLPKRLKALYVSTRGRLYRVESSPTEKATRLIRTTWAEELAKDKKDKEIRA